jgi:flagellar hook-length control protein FliK
MGLLSLPITPLGAALTLGQELLPIALHGLKGSGKGLSFAGHLDQQLQQGTNENSDVLSQLAGLLQAGMPMSAVADAVSKKLAIAVAKATGNAGNADAQQTLQRALASALAPPGTSPPQLEQRLSDMLTKLTSEFKTAGQQNEFSGAILDAASAEDIPAQQMKTTTGAQAPASISSLVHSLLSGALASLQSAVAAPAQAAVPGSLPAMPALPIVPAQVAQMAGFALPSAQQPDILARMLGRAANADAQRTSAKAGTADAAVSGRATNAAPNANGATGSTGTSANPGALFARLLTVIAQNNSGQSSGGDGKPADFASQQNPLLAQQHDSGSVSTAPAFSAQLTTASASSAQPQQSVAASPYTTADPQAIIEQVVTGIVMRNSGSTSEVRMRLQPDHLGDVALKLTVNGNTINASLVAQNPHVRDMLLANQQQLARSLADAGLSLGTFSVDVSGGNGNSAGQQQAAQHRSLGKSGALNLGLVDDEADSRFGPSIVLGAQSLVLNYLA